MIYCELSMVALIKVHPLSSLDFKTLKLKLSLELFTLNTSLELVFTSSKSSILKTDKKIGWYIHFDMHFRNLFRI